MGHEEIETDENKSLEIEATNSEEDNNESITEQKKSLLNVGNKRGHGNFIGILYSDI